MEQQDDENERGLVGTTGRTERGQLNFDFTIGVSIFVLAIVFTFLIAPGMFTTTTPASQATHELQAERVGGWLTGEALGSGDQPSAYCLVGLVAGPTTTPTDGCDFSGGTVESRVPVDASANITVRRGGSIQCWDDGDERFADAGSGGCTDRLVAGPPYEYANEIGTARKTMRAGQTDLTVVVRVW